MPQVGDQITPTIRLVRELGAGGMGSVWVADHGALQTQVVVKFMHAALAADKEYSQRFSREAAAGANVKSPHVVQVYDHGVAPDGAPFIVMEMLDGHDLGAHVEQHGVMTLGEVAVIISQTCKALARAHERGIVHRDIKPQNIFLTYPGGDEVFVKVLDFGIAKTSELTASAGTGTKTGAMLGTPYYMSPEQVVGRKGVDHRADLWALGIVAFECLTGRNVFEAETVGGLAVEICGGPIPVPSRIKPALPPELDRWFARACARDLTQRFGSARELAESLLVVAGAAPNSRSSYGDASGGFPVPVATPIHGGAWGLRAPAPRAHQHTPGPAGVGVPPYSVTTQAPVSSSGGAAPVPRRASRSAVLGVAAVLVLVAIGAGVKLATRGTEGQVAAVAPPVDSTPPVASSTPPSPSTSVGAAASASPPVDQAGIYDWSPRPPVSAQPASPATVTGRAATAGASRSSKSQTATVGPGPKTAASKSKGS